MLNFSAQPVLGEGDWEAEIGSRVLEDCSQRQINAISEILARSDQPAGLSEAPAGLTFPPGTGPGIGVSLEAPNDTH